MWDNVLEHLLDLVSSFLPLRHATQLLILIQGQHKVQSLPVVNALLRQPGVEFLPAANVLNCVGTL